MKKNETDLIKSKKNRLLTAKGYKFLNNCIELAANQRGLNRYHNEFKPLKEKIKTIIEDLIIDKNLSIEQIKEIAQKNRFLH